MTFFILFKKNLGKIAAPIKKNKNAIIKVSNKLHGMGVKESDKNAANTIKTIIGLKI
jgi:hypothetical protein